MTDRSISLMLDARKVDTWRVDGPAIRLKLKGEPWRWLPLRRLARVFVVGELTASCAPLLACSDTAIPVAFYSGRGKLRAMLMPSATQETTLAALLERLGWDQQLQAIYADWDAHQAAHWYADLLGEARPVFRQKQLINRIGSVLGKFDLQQFCSWLEGFFEAHLREVLQKFGILHCEQARPVQVLLQEWQQAAITVLSGEWLAAFPDKHGPRAAWQCFQRHEAWLTRERSRQLQQLIWQLEAVPERMKRHECVDSLL
ncbi:hypothetical protein WH50_24980 [Pokkaliibacter plantistimulans]|uniref:Uncharacterized protein n=1 Tax=Pokkaliibacter plantistimulans TaxID=1635171 RepID=A0ABX5LPU3_9GAMM|nr:CRISPR-associated endonuclease Cas1 [Pokkaliibacter plantistimulans]PXF28687.1 hypothetical protein WH50_24980 [Pokkaliibacter plantistimulans]